MSLAEARADGAELAADVPVRVGDRGDDREDLVGRRVGREVEVGRPAGRGTRRAPGRRRARARGRPRRTARPARRSRRVAARRLQALDGVRHALHSARPSDAHIGARRRKLGACRPSGIQASRRARDPAAADRARGRRPCLVALRARRGSGARRVGARRAPPPVAQPACRDRVAPTIRCRSRSSCRSPCRPTATGLHRRRRPSTRYTAPLGAADPPTRRGRSAPRWRSASTR